MHVRGLSDVRYPGYGKVLTFRGAFKANVELLHVVIDECDFVVAHHHLHDICFYSPLWAAHLARPPQWVCWCCSRVRCSIDALEEFGVCFEVFGST